MAIQGNGVIGLTPYQEGLASITDVTRKRSSSDGIVSSGGPKAPTTTEGATDGGEDQQATAPKRPTLADVTPDVQYRTVDGLVRSQDRLAQNRWAIDLHHRRVRQNIPFTYLDKIPNQAMWIARTPNGMSKERAGSTPNKADDLINHLVAAIQADPAKPNPQPSTDSEAASQAADLCAAFLRELMGESGVNWQDKHRWGLDVALTCGSAFLHYDVDPVGGGYQPLQTLAHPQATDPNNPLVAVDPTTGAPLPAVDPVLRYVSAQSQFVETAEEADRVWLPKITCDRIRREQVRMFPPNADVETAEVVVLLLWCTLADGMKKWPDTVGTMDGTQLATLASWRPSLGSDQIVPFMLRAGLADGQGGPGVSDVGSLSPLLQRRMYYYRCYVKKSPEYQGGLCLDTSGYDGGTQLGQSSMEYRVTLPVGGTDVRCRDIPLEQIRPQQDTDGGDPMGWPVIARFAGASDAEAAQYSAYQDAIQIRLRPHVFIRSTAAVNDDDWADRSTPIILNPTDPEPTYEQFSALPGEFLPMIENIDRKMDSAAMLGEEAQGLQTQTAVSGVAKQITVQAANRNLSGMLQQYNASNTRGWRICCQLAQAFYTVPQMIQISGEDGSTEAQWWTGEDLGGIDEIGIEPGTGTMATPEGKAQLVAFAQSMGWLTPEKGAKVALVGVTRELGLPADPITEAIERAVGVWLKGPPEGWQPAAPQIDPLTGAPAIDPNTGQPAMTPPSFTPFMPRPNDTEPLIAKRWMDRLSELQMTAEYTRFDPGWRALADQRYMAARQAVAIASAPPAPAGAPGQPGQPPHQQGAPQRPQMPQPPHGPSAPSPMQTAA